MSHRHSQWAQWIAFAGTLLVAADAGAQADAALDARLDALDAQVTAAEDLSALKRLQRKYGYYVDKGNLARASRWAFAHLGDVCGGHWRSLPGGAGARVRATRHWRAGHLMSGYGS
jgi:hypothetical protein